MALMWVLSFAIWFILFGLGLTPETFTLRWWFLVVGVIGLVMAAGMNTESIAKRTREIMFGKRKS
ncbi:hypothetical protein [Paramicrobacterium agarici]|uniref:hypothetical protein n=1 Tax=Paramicrobacterium agarici TaxID=630514 RepID=UPI0011505BA6|nr:hypothetical protein [Microbacterium agarici]TQO23819.1 hypothetical protein FB385_2681 [Microbacterium agarici]